MLVLEEKVINKSPMKKNKSIKLSLNKETISNMKTIRGGAAMSHDVAMCNSIKGVCLDRSPVSYDTSSPAENASCGADVCLEIKDTIRCAKTSR